MNTLAEVIRNIFVIPQKAHESAVVWSELTTSYQAQLWTLELDSIQVAYYYSPQVQADIHDFKYHHETQRIKKYAQTLQEKLQVFSTKALIVYPAVTTKSRLLRGKNHMKRLVRSVRPQQHSLDVFQRKSSKHQAQLSREERRKNVTNRYLLKPRYQKKLVWAHVILIDDVISSGSTANELAKILKMYGVKRVDGIFIASSHKALANT